MLSDPGRILSATGFGFSGCTQQPNMTPKMTPIIMPATKLGTAAIVIQTGILSPERRLFLWSSRSSSPTCIKKTY